MIIFLLVCLVFAVFCYWQNNSIVITKSTYSSAKIPREFDGYVIAHISDLHNKEFGADQQKILQKLKSTSPDVILITGDLVDRRRYDLDAAMRFVRGAVSLAPVFYVSGNHEAWSGHYEEIRQSLLDAGVSVLEDSTEQVTIGENSIRLLGAKDPAFYTSESAGKTDITPMVTYLQEWSSREEFQILLSHRPELFDLYANNNIDLIFSGHAHGGQIRLPLIGPLIAPDQGFFPQYTSGSHTQKHSTMFVSRGLGNSLFPLRIFNRPEIVIVTLQSQTLE